MAPFDFRAVGVRQTASGKWEVGFRYCGTRRNIGTFDTQDLAALANRVGRQLLTAEKGVTLTAAEIEENVMLARAASVKAVSKLQHEDDAPPNEENRLEILLLSEEAADRPRLLSIRLQPEKTFDEWLTHGKQTWKEKKQKLKNERKEAQQKVRNNNKRKARIVLSSSESQLASTKQSVPAEQRGTALEMATALLFLSGQQGKTAEQGEAPKNARTLYSSAPLPAVACPPPVASDAGVYASAAAPRRAGRPRKVPYHYDPALVTATVPAVGGPSRGPAAQGHVN